MRLHSKIAIITGGARGIGRAIAQSFVREGAKVVIADKDLEEAEKTASALNDMTATAAIALHIDVSSPDASLHLMAETESRLGAPDILVCSAGIVRPGAMIEDIQPNTWDQMLAVNLMGCVHPTRAFIPVAKRRGSGRIIYIGSVAGQVGGVSAEMTYSVSKAGVLALTKALARQAAPYGVTVNAIAPGAVETAMTDVLNYDASVRASIPLGDYGRVEDIAAAALYLASEDGRYVTGSTLDVNGGLFMR